MVRISPDIRMGIPFLRSAIRPMASVRRKSKRSPAERAIPAKTGDHPNRWRSGRNHTIRNPWAIPLKSRFAERIEIMARKGFFSEEPGILGDSLKSTGLYLDNGILDESRDLPFILWRISCRIETPFLWSRIFSRTR